MQYVLLIAERPKSDSEGRFVEGAMKHYWPTLLTQSQDILQQVPDSLTLGEGLWQLPLERGMLGFADLVIACRNNMIPFRFLILDLKEKPNWSSSVTTPIALPS